MAETNSGCRIVTSGDGFPYTDPELRLFPPCRENSILKTIRSTNTLPDSGRKKVASNVYVYATCCNLYLLQIHWNVQFGKVSDATWPRNRCHPKAMTVSSSFRGLLYLFFYLGTWLFLFKLCYIPLFFFFHYFKRTVKMLFTWIPKCTVCVNVTFNLLIQLV